MSTPIRVLIADDQALVRSALRLILEGDPELTVLGEAADGQGALDAARRLRPDIILLDLHMPGRDGVWASERISELAPDVKVLVLTAFDTDRLVASALRAGAVGFLLKDSDPDRLVSAIHTVAKGGCVVSDSLVGRLVSELSRRKGQPSEQKAADHREHGLTDREAEVIKLLAEGRSNRDIADELYLEISTVKAHVGKIVSKLGVHNRVQIAIWAFATGMATPRIGNHGGSQHA